MAQVKCYTQPPFIKGNLFVTDISIKTYERLKDLVDNKMSIYNVKHGTFHPASVVMNWQLSIVHKMFDSDELYIVYNLSKYKTVETEPELFDTTSNTFDSDGIAEVDFEEVQ